MRIQASLPKSCFLSSSGTLPHPHGQALNVVSPPAPPPTRCFTPDMPKGARRGRGPQKKDLRPPPILCLDSPSLHLPMLALPGVDPPCCVDWDSPLTWTSTSPLGPGFQGQGFPDHGHHVLSPAHLSTFPAGQTGPCWSSGG